MDIRYRNFEICLELTRCIKPRKMITQRIVTLEDITSILTYIREVWKKGSLVEYRYQHYIAFILFGAYTGQRSMATISHLTAGQFIAALGSDKHVRSSQVRRAIWGYSFRENLLKP